MVPIIQVSRLMIFLLIFHILEPLTPEEMTPLASDVQIMSAAWRAATAQPVQPRTIATIRQIRKVLVAKLGGDGPVPLPAWLPVSADEPAPAEAAAGGDVDPTPDVAG